MAQCSTCGQRLPEGDPDRPPTRRRHRFTITPPPGEEHTLDDLLVQLADRYGAAYDLPKVGSVGWKYPILHFALYAVLTARGDALTPAEEGG